MMIFYFQLQRSALGCVAHEGQIFVCGGYDGVSSQSSCEVYKPHTQTWDMMKYVGKLISSLISTVNSTFRE